MDKDYWENYYIKHGLDPTIKQPSSFAIFVQERYLKNVQKNILEIGSGNGRDAIFFAEHKHNIVAVDQSHSAISIAKKIKYNSKIKFLEDDFVKMNYEKFQNIDAVYSRFTLHAIKQKECEIVLTKVYNILKNNGLFMIEARSTKDPLCGVGKKVGKYEYITTHYRRFIDSNQFVKKLLNLGFKLCFFTEENNLSIVRKDNPYLIRVILQK